MRAILIGGTSHVGKSSFAEELASEVGWQPFSTDRLARHPGRPWGGEIPRDVYDYYLSSSPNKLVEDVLDHYRKNVWPIAKAILQTRVSNSYDSCIVLEGSAILPKCVVDTPIKQTLSIWFTASEEVITGRIRRNSSYLEKSPLDQRMIDVFLERSLIYNDWLKRSLEQTGQRSIDVSDERTTHQLREEFVDLIENV